MVNVFKGLFIFFTHPLITKHGFCIRLPGAYQKPRPILTLTLMGDLDLLAFS